MVCLDHVIGLYIWLYVWINWSKKHGKNIVGIELKFKRFTVNYILIFLL